MALTADGTCPKCGAPRLQAASECLHCGVIFSKFKPRPAAVPEAITDGGLRVRVAAAPDPLETIARAGRGPLLIGLMVWSGKRYFDSG